jgi:hypothetical protein
MSYRLRGSYSKPKNFFNWLILLVFALLVGLAIFAVSSGNRQSPLILDSKEMSSVINVQVAGTTFSPIPTTNLTFSLFFSPISQRDKRQYSSEEEWKEWSPSACSPAAVASVLNGYGKKVTVSEVLGLMLDQGAISSSKGLFRYGVFSTIASKYGLRAEYSDSKDLNVHFDTVMTAVQKGYPAIMNIQDATYFPNGHFIVAIRANPNDTVSVINPDPARGSPVVQEWPRDALKTYFSRSLRSAVFFPNQS